MIVWKTSKMVFSSASPGQISLRRYKGLVMGIFIFYPVFHSFCDGTGVGYGNATRSIARRATNCGASLGVVVLCLLYILTGFHFIVFNGLHLFVPTWNLCWFVEYTYVQIKVTVSGRQVRDKFISSHSIAPRVAK